MIFRNRRKLGTNAEKGGKPELTAAEKHSNYLNFLLVAWFLESCALGPNLISQVLLPPVIRILFSITSVLVLVSVPGRMQVKKKNSVYNIVIITGLLIHNLGLIISFNDPLTFDALIGKLMMTLTLIVAYMCMDEEIFVKCMDAYCKFMMFFAVSAIIVSAVVLIVHLPPVNDYTAPEGRVYENYIIAFVEAEVDGMSGFKRAGSFYDEPGTFAVFLIPALLWTMLVRPSVIIFISLFVALILTFSIGGWLSFGIALIYVIKIYPDVIKKYQTTIISVFFVLGVLTCLNMLATFLDLGWLSVYFDSKFTGSGSPNTTSSMNIRENEIDTFFTTLAESPIGYGLKSPKIPMFSIGLLASSIEAGFLGAMGYAMTVVGMLGILIENFVATKKKQSRAVAAMLGSNLSMLFMSTQRIDTLAFYTGIFMVAFLMNCSVVSQPKVLTISPEPEPEVIPEDEKFQDDSPIVSALKESKIGKTISKIFESSKKSPVGKEISKIFTSSKESNVGKTISKIFTFSKESNVGKTISKIFTSSKESNVGKTISKIFTSSKKATLAKTKQSRSKQDSTKSQATDGMEELRQVLKDLQDLDDSKK